jgi:hypothetical protein
MHFGIPTFWGGRRSAQSQVRGSGNGNSEKKVEEKSGKRLVGLKLRIFLGSETNCD